MRTSSAKAKGRRAASETKDLLLKYAPDLQPTDIEVTSSGAIGEDLKLSPAARQVYPFIVENKCVEKLNVWEAYEQACGHRRPEHGDGFLVPVVFFRRNRSKLMALLDAEHFIKLVR